jgi:hypothetical protein
MAEIRAKITRPINIGSCINPFSKAINPNIISTLPLVFNPKPINLAFHFGKPESLDP